MSVPVKIQDIVDGMESQSDLCMSYLHRASGAVYTIGDYDVGFDDAGETGHDLGVITEAIERDPDSFLALPDRFEIDEYRMMEEFASAAADPVVQQQLLRSLRGSGAFRRFKDAVHRLGMARSWYQARADVYARIARAWCRQHDIPVQGDGS